MRPNTVTLTVTQNGLHSSPSITAAELLTIAADMAVTAIVNASLDEPDTHQAAASCVEWLHTNVATAVYEAVTEHQNHEEWS